MVGPLGVLPDTPDYKRYSMQGRLLDDVRYAGDSGIITRKLSYIPMKDGKKIDPNIILSRHRDVLEFINKPENYFERDLEYLRHRNRKPLVRRPINSDALRSLANSIYVQGFRSGYGKEYFSYLHNVLRHDKNDFPDAVRYAVEGHHLITTTKESLKADNVNVSLERILKDKGEMLRNLGYGCIKDIINQYNEIKDNFKVLVDEKYRRFIDNIRYNQNRDFAINI